MLKKVVILIGLVVSLVFLANMFFHDDEHATKKESEISVVEQEDFSEDIVTLPYELNTSGGDITVDQLPTVPISQDRFKSYGSDYALYGNYVAYEIPPYMITDDFEDSGPIIQRATTTCTAFRVLDGRSEYLPKFIEDVKKNHYTNTLDESGNLLLTLNLNDVLPYQQDLLTNSRENLYISVRNNGIGTDPRIPCSRSYVTLLGVFEE